MYFKFAEMGRAVNKRQPSTSRGAKILWMMDEQRRSREEYHDQGRGREIESRVSVRQAMWENNYKARCQLSKRC